MAGYHEPYLCSHRPGCIQSKRQISMKTTYFSMMCAVSLLAVGSSAALALSSPEGVQAREQASESEGITPGDPTVTYKFIIVDGAGSVELGITAPVNEAFDYSGNQPDPLPEDTRMTLTVYRSCYEVNEEQHAIGTIEDVAPGQEMTFTDSENIQMGKSYSYNVVASIGDKTSSLYGGSAYVYAGIRPAMPEFTSIDTNKGNGPATLDVLAPSKDDRGNDLEVPLTKMVLKRQLGYEGATDLAVIDNPVAGQAYQFVDDSAEVGNAYRYLVYVECEYGQSYDQTSNMVSLTQDAPGAPQNQVAEFTDNGVVITWTAPEVSANGGYFDPELVTYDVYRWVNGEAGKLIAENLSVLTCIDDVSDIEKPTMMGWQVRAKNENGESSPWGLTSNELIVGPAAKLPFVENFNVWTSEWNVSSDNLWIGARIDGGYLSWTVTEYVSCFFKENAEAEKIYGVDAADGAKDGVVYLNISDWAQGTASYTSSNIESKGMDNMLLTFYCYCYPNAVSEIAVNILAPAAGDDAVVREIGTVNLGDVEAQGWKKVSFPVVGFEDAESIQIQFVGTAEKGDADHMPIPVIIDKISLRNYPAPAALEGECGQDGKVSLKWDAPATEETIVNYVVSRDGVKLGETKDTMFIDSPEADGTYSYSVEAVYACDEEFYNSQAAVVEVVAVNTGVESIYAGEIVSSVWYDVTGRELSSPEPGTVAIRKVIFSDGSVKVFKAVVR